MSFVRSMSVALAASGRTNLKNSAETNYITDDDLTRVDGTFNKATLQNKTVAADITDQIVRVYINGQADKFFDVPANNSTAVLSDVEFQDLLIVNTDAVNAITELIIIVEKV